MTGREKELGREGELVLVERLKTILPENMVVFDTNDFNNNAPFDILVWDKQTGRYVAMFEVKTLALHRKHDWIQQKRPAIKRKLAFWKKNGQRAKIYTVAVKQRCAGDVHEIRWIVGLPSVPLDWLEGIETLFAKLRLDHEHSD